MSRAKRFPLDGTFRNSWPLLHTTPWPRIDHELLWQTGRRDPKCYSGGRFAAATVMTTTFIPTRSGDGTFVLEFVPSQYTLFVVFFGPYPRVILDARLTLGPAGVCDFSCPVRGMNCPGRKANARLDWSQLIRHNSMELPAEGLHNYYRSPAPRVLLLDS